MFSFDLDSYTEDPTGVEARLRFLVLCTRAREDLHFAHRGTHEPPSRQRSPTPCWHVTTVDSARSLRLSTRAVRIALEIDGEQHLVRRRRYVSAPVT
ncbi:hypothetical protein GCM10020229_36420 [Kitasatospora albolonga]